MRVTQTMLANNTLTHINKGYQNLANIQDQLATGKKITKASQDPVIAMNGMRYRTQVTEVMQFKRNFSEAQNWIEQADSSLSETTQALQRIRELTVQAANDSNNADQRKIMATEIRQLQEHIASIGNTKVNDKYIFNGTDTTNAPVDLSKLAAYIADPVNNPSPTSTNLENVQVELIKGVNIVTNIRPQNVFSNDLFADLETIIQDLSNPAVDVSQKLTQALDKLDKHMVNITTEQAELGAKMNRMDMMEQRITQQEVTAKRMMSDNEDADMEEVIINLRTQESVHRAAMAAGARIIQPSLMDFLR